MANVEIIKGKGIIPIGTTTIYKVGQDYYDRENLVSIDIPSSVKKIDNNAFERCTRLKKLEIPESVEFIGINAFQDCTGLNEIRVSPKNKVYESRERGLMSKNCNAIIDKTTNTLLYGCQTTIIPSSVTTIEGGAFWNCKGLTSIEIPDSVKEIRDDAFYGCEGLNKVEIQGDLLRVGGTAFMGCTNLKEVVFGGDVMKIGELAFERCTSLSRIEFHGEVMKIAYNAFYYCDSLDQILVPVNTANSYKKILPDKYHRLIEEVCFSE